MPARVITPKERGNRGFIPTDKNHLGIIEYESCIERDFFLEAIHDPNVCLIHHQPITIVYQLAGKETRKYTPDAHLEFEDGTKLLVEIKSDSELQDNRESYEDRWNAAHKWAEEHGMAFLVLTENEIRTPRWLNIWFTLGSSKCISNERYMEKLNVLIHPDGEEYNSLCYKLSRELELEIGKAAQILCYAIYHGHVFVDTFSSKQLSKTTIIRKNGGTKKPAFKPIWKEFHLEFERDLKSCNDQDRVEIQLKNLSPELVHDSRYEEITNKHEAMVLAWLKQPKSRKDGEWRANFCEEWQISESKIYRLVNKYNEIGKEALYPKHENAGKKVQFDELVLQCIEEARVYYLSPGVTQNMAYERLKKLCEERKVEIPTFSGFKWHIYQKSTKSDFALKKGRKYYKSHFTPTLTSFQGGILPMQVVQMDNTPFDVLPVDEDEREALSAPDMTAAIDCYSGMISGFSVSYFPSSSRTILEVLVQSILPKTEFVDTYETQHEWPIQGFPVVILVDNGMDYRASVLKSFCKKYDIIIEFVPLRTPRYKAYIE